MATANCDKCLNKFSSFKTDITEKPLADFLCYDCDKYLCSNCVNAHHDHGTISRKDTTNETKLHAFCEDMIRNLTSEGDQIIQKLTEERTHKCDVVQVSGGKFNVTDICILHESKQWVITDRDDKCIKVFNINNNEMAVSIYLQHKPHGITEIPSKDPSQSLIAVSFPFTKHIEIWNIRSTPANIISRINVQCECFGLAYCNNKFITYRYSIHVIDMSGKIIHLIDSHKFPDKQNLKWFGAKSISVHSESETIYVCNRSCVISMSIDGRVLQSIDFSDLNPSNICVDKDQTVYVMDSFLPLFKLPKDLRQKIKMFKEDVIGLIDIKQNVFTAIACQADTFYLPRFDGYVDGSIYENKALTPKKLQQKVFKLFWLV